jgi:hypothetical protein
MKQPFPTLPAGETPPQWRSADRAAKNWAAMKVREGYVKDGISQLDLGGLAMMVCAEYGLPSHMALDLADVMMGFFPERSINARTLYRFGLYLQANRANLSKGVVVPSIDHGEITGDFWARLLCTDVFQTTSSAKGTSMWAVTFLILDTPLAGGEFATIISGKFLRGMVRVISRASREKESCLPEYVFGMRMCALLGKGSREGIVIKKIEDSLALQNKNAALRKYRWECKHAPCLSCPRGLDKCSHAIRRLSWHKVICPKCGTSVWATASGITMCNCKGVNNGTNRN